MRNTIKAALYVFGALAMIALLIWFSYTVGPNAVGVLGGIGSLAYVIWIVKSWLDMQDRKKPPRDPNTGWDYGRGPRPPA